MGLFVNPVRSSPSPGGSLFPGCGMYKARHLQCSSARRHCQAFANMGLARQGRCVPGEWLLWGSVRDKRRSSSGSQPGTWVLQGQSCYCCCQAKGKRLTSQPQSCQGGDGGLVCLPAPAEHLLSAWWFGEQSVSVPIIESLELSHRKGNTQHAIFSFWFLSLGITCSRSQPAVAHQALVLTDSIPWGS